MKVNKKITGGKVKKDLDAATRIRKLRGSLTQAKFAELLHVAQPMVSAWEAGRELPSSADLWIKFGEFAGYPDCYWFWERAGLNRQKLLAATERMLKDQIKDADLPFLANQIVLVPRVRKTSHGLEPTGNPLPMPAEAIPNALSTYCFILEGYEAVVDTTDAGAGNVLPFLGKLVLARFAPKTERENYPWPEGLFIGVLDWPEEKRMLGKIEWVLRFLPLAYIASEFREIIVGLWTEREFEAPVTKGPIATWGDFEAKFIRDAKQAFPRQEGESEEDWVARAVKSEREKRESPEALLAMAAHGMAGLLEGQRIGRARMERAASEVRIPPGCEIVGRVIVQFPTPEASKVDK